MEERVRFQIGGGGRGDGEPEEKILPIIWRVVRDYPEARRAIEAALEKVREGSIQNDRAA